MKLYEFSEESVERAEALRTLKFDVVQVTGPQMPAGIGGLMTKKKVVAKDVYRVCELPEDWFPEIEEGQSVSVSYIIHHEKINAVLKSPPFNMTRGEATNS